jgi:hypothetical protein
MNVRSIESQLVLFVASVAALIVVIVAAEDHFDEKRNADPANCVEDELVLREGASTRRMCGLWCPNVANVCLRDANVLRCLCEGRQ